MLEDGDDTSDLMPEIVEAVNDIQTESEEESEEASEEESEPKPNIIIDDAFENKTEEIENEKLGVTVKPIKKETPKNELIEQIKENLKDETPKEIRRRKQLAHLKMMRDKKKLLAEEKKIEKIRMENLQEEEKNSLEKTEEEPQTPRPQKNFLEKSSIKNDVEEPTYKYKNISLTEDQLKELLEEASVKSIVKYKAQKKKKEKKEKKPVEPVEPVEPIEPKSEPVKINPVNDLVYQNEVNYFSSFF